MINTVAPNRGSKRLIYINKRERCALNKEVLDLLNEESISGDRNGRASLLKSTAST